MALLRNQPVKGLNKGPGKKKFVFKSFSQHLEEIDINVFRSLEPVKFEPSQGLSSFFLESLLQWRELNSAADFLSLYEELLPLVQTLHQILHNKKEIALRLLSRVHMQAKLSLEPILSLVAALSRDLREEFSEFLPQVVRAFVSLLRAGGDRDPEILEQVFRALSHIVKNMQTILVKDTVTMMRISKQLRYYHKDYVRGFMAEVISYLLRKASVKDMIKGIRKSLKETVSEPSLERKDGCSTFLWNILKGPGEKFHSKAEQVLRILVDKYTYNIGTQKIVGDVTRASSEKQHDTSDLLWNVLCGPAVKFCLETEEAYRTLLLKNPYYQGDSIIVEVVINTLQQLCEQVKREELSILWNCFLEEVFSLLSNIVEDPDDQENYSHLRRMLSLLNIVVKFQHGSKVIDYSSLFELADQLVKLRMNIWLKNIPIKESTHALVLLIYQLLLHLVHNHSQVGAASSGPTAILNLHAKWTCLFEAKDICLLIFTKDLLEEEIYVMHPFRLHILSTLDFFIEDHPSAVMPLLVKYYEKVKEVPQKRGTGGKEDESVTHISRYISSLIETTTERMKTGNVFVKENSLKEMSSLDPTLIEGALKCFPYNYSLREKSAVIWNLAMAIDDALAAETGSSNDPLKEIWCFVMGSALICLIEIFRSDTSQLLQYLSLVLKFASNNKMYMPVVSAVADFLDALFGIRNLVDCSNRGYHPELQQNRISEAFKLFADNLGVPDKRLRLATLRFLCHFEPLPVVLANSSERPEKRRKIDKGTCDDASLPYSTVLHQMLLVEETPLGIDTSRKITGIISTIQMDICAGRIPTCYMTTLIQSLMGAFYNRLELLWNPLIECTAVLLERHQNLVWPTFMHQLERSQCIFLAHQVHASTLRSSDPGKEEDFNFESTTVGTIVSLLIRTAQRVPKISLSSSDQLVTFFFTFLGYSNQSIESIEKYDKSKCKGKEWKNILKEWLVLMKEMMNSGSILKNHNLKEVLSIRLLQESDPDVQYKTLECLLSWRDSFLLPYEKHLKNLISVKTVSDEVIIWSLSKESGQIQNCDREGLIPVIVNLLIPKVKNIKAVSSRKSAGSLQRKAFLRFLSQLEPSELAPLFILVFQSLQDAFHDDYALIPGPKQCLEKTMKEFATWDFLQLINKEKLMSMPYKLQLGFLHVIKDILEIFDTERISTFLIPLLAFVLCILESSASSLDHAKGMKVLKSIKESNNLLDCARANKEGSPNSSENKRTREERECHLVNESAEVRVAPLQDATIDERHAKILNQDKGKKDDKIPLYVANMKELRSLCLKIVSIVVANYEIFDYGTEFWNRLFAAIRPLIENFAQESGKNEVPSSLFSIFLSLSKSSILVQYLLREQTVVPSIISLLSFKKVSDSVVSAVFSFVENILNLEDENCKCASYHEVLLPHLDILFKGMQNVVELWCNKKRKRMVGLGERELGIFKILGKYTTNSVVVDQFVDCLLAFLNAKNDRNKEVCQGILLVIREILPAVGSMTANKLLKSFSSLFSFATLDIRLILCDILIVMSKRDSSMNTTAQVISDLNAISSSTIGEYDYDKRLAAFEQINPGFFSQLSEQQTLLVLSHCVYDMSSDDLSIRNSASKSLLSFINFCSLVLRKEEKLSDVNNDNELSAEQDLRSMPLEAPVIHCNDITSKWSKISIRRVIQKFLLSHIRNALAKSGNADISFQREWMSLLRSMVISLPGISILNECKPLLSIEDSEVDFFNNIFHIQKHRRARAMSRFQKILKTFSMSETTLVQIFVPLFYNLLIEGKLDKDGNLANHILETLASISAHLGWNSYFSLLLKTFRLMPLKPEHNKVLVRLICSLLDNFHFGQSGQLEKNCNKTENDRTMKDVSKRGNNGGLFVPLEIQQRLKDHVLPAMNKMIASQSDMVNISVSMALLKLLKLLPMETLEAELPCIIQHIANQLKSRMDSMRDEARSVLVACAKELGPHYLHFIVKTLQITLRRGFELHVLGYSLNFILLKISPSLKTGDIDCCVKQILDIVENDIMGEVSEEKEVEKIASKMKETKKCRSFNTLQIIAQKITFSSHAGSLLAPVIRNLPRSLAPKVKVKIETMLQHLASGLESNMSLTRKDLFIFVYGLVEDCREGEDMILEIDSASGNGQTITVMKKSEIHRDNIHEDHIKKMPNTHMIMEFALRLLENSLKKMNFKQDHKFFISMLDPFVNLLHQSLKSKYEGVISGSVKCLRYLLRLPLPSIATSGHDITSTIFEMTLRSGRIDTPLMKSIINLVIVILRNADMSISNDQLQMLLQCPLFIDLESWSSSSALTLLKAIVRRKLLVPDLYDLITRVARLMITSQVHPIRQQCSRILLQFLLDYPLGKKRLHQHLEFLIANLSYEHASGREAVLDMLHVIILRFPVNVVDENAEMFFLPLVTRLVNDIDGQVRAMVGTVVKVLVGRVGPGPLKRLLSFSLSWYKGEKQRLWRPAAQVIGLLIEVIKTHFEPYIEDIRIRAQYILRCAITAVEQGTFDPNEKDQLVYWQEAYYSLIMLEKLFLQFPEAPFHKDFEEIWQCICHLLVHPHVWIRNASSRLILSYFSSYTSDTGRGKLHSKSDSETMLLLQPSRLFLLAASFCHQLDADLFDDATSGIMIKNLVYVMSALRSFVESKRKTDLNEFFFTLDTVGRSVFLKALSLIGLKSCQRTSAVLHSRLNNTCDPDAEQDMHQQLEIAMLDPLFKKLGKVALRVQESKTKIIFNAYKVLFTHMGLASIQTHIQTLLLPVYKLSEGFVERVVPEELKVIAEEVLNQLQDIVGTEIFVQAYNSVREKVKSVRNKKRQARKIMAVLNPMRHAKHKKVLAAKRKIQKKRKSMKNKVNRRF